ncbi:MAG TPA: GNAT family N-acetyltransferase [Ilumatobacteraceae bacterium]|nr:GNAT family N-acetyltransferase [Ilumatobacteraceae bacterium]
MTPTDDPFGNRIELLEPVVVRWWNQRAEFESVRAEYLPRVDGTGDPTSMWIADVDGEPAGLLQHYRHVDHSAHDAAVGVPNAVGIDYLLGSRHRGRGLGGLTSCAVLERAGFTRSLDCQPPDEPPAAVYVPNIHSRELVGE